MHDQQWVKESGSICQACAGKNGFSAKIKHSRRFLLLLFTALFLLAATLLTGLSVLPAAAEGNAAPKYTIREVIRNDFDDMAKNREIRVLVVNSKTSIHLAKRLKTLPSR
jgi:hypothetical protein